jgi:hypothetical protein
VISVRSQTIARIVLVTTLASMMLPALLITLVLARQSGAPNALTIFAWASALNFHGAFDAGQWIGFAIIALIILFSGFLALHASRSWARLLLGVLIAAAVSAGLQGYRYQQQRVALAAANWALCPSADKSNGTARDLRAALDARIGAVRAGTRFHQRVPIDDTVARYIPAGVSLAKAETMAKEAGLNVHAPARFRREEEGGSALAFSANCDYDAGPFASQAISIDVYQGADASGRAVVSRTQAAIINSAL